MRVSIALLFLILASEQVFSQVDPRRGPLGCVPIAERTMEVGCYVVSRVELGALSAGPHYWHLDTYPTRAAADAAKIPTSGVVEAFGRIWLFTVADQAWRPAGGERIAAIGPLTVKAGVNHTASYLEAIMLPGAESSVHHHPGPEALYPLTGEECMETPEGKQVGKPSQSSIIVPGYVPHKLSITGTERRTSLGLILHESSQAITMREHEHGWKPKGLCGAE
jgi:hypothetical protein